MATSVAFLPACTRHVLSEEVLFERDGCELVERETKRDWTMGSTRVIGTRCGPDDQLLDVLYRASATAPYSVGLEEDARGATITVGICGYPLNYWSENFRTVNDRTAKAGIKFVYFEPQNYCVDKIAALPGGIAGWNYVPPELR